MPAVAAAAEAGAAAQPLADPGLAKINETYLKDGKPDFEKIAADLARAHTEPETTRGGDSPDAPRGSSRKAMNARNR